MRQTHNICRCLGMYQRMVAPEWYHQAAEKRADLYWREYQGWLEICQEKRRQAMEYLFITIGVIYIIGLYVSAWIYGRYDWQGISDNDFLYFYCLVWFIIIPLLLLDKLYESGSQSCKSRK